MLAAVKVIRPALLRDGTAGGELHARARFAQEVNAIGSVVNHRVPTLLGADTAAEQPWLAMDYVHGPCASARRTRPRPTPQPPGGR